APLRDPDDDRRTVYQDRLLPAVDRRLPGTGEIGAPPALPGHGPSLRRGPALHRSTCLGAPACPPILRIGVPVGRLSIGWSRIGEPAVCGCPEPWLATELLDAQGQRPIQGRPIDQVEGLRTDRLEIQAARFGCMGVVLREGRASAVGGLRSSNRGRSTALRVTRTFWLPATGGRTSVTMVIDVQGLTKRYGARLAVDDVGFTVTEGEIFGILGVNGAGKTTTVECLQGLRRPDGGRMRVLGLDPRTAGSQLRARVGSQLQASALPDRLRVDEAVLLFGDGDRRSADRLLETWHLARLRRSSFASLSGGQRQRLFIALALLNKPQVVFFD